MWNRRLSSLVSRVKPYSDRHRPSAIVDFWPPSNVGRLGARPISSNFNSIRSSICSVRGSRMSTVSNSRASTTPGTPAQRSRRNSTCTFSVTLGLAKLLNERGITAATPSTLVTPSFTPTATPCNSPEGGSTSSTPAHSRSVSPSMAPFSGAFGLPGKCRTSYRHVASFKCATWPSLSLSRSHSHSHRLLFRSCR